MSRVVDVPLERTALCNKAAAVTPSDTIPKGQWYKSFSVANLNHLPFTDGMSTSIISSLVLELKDFTSS